MRKNCPPDIFTSLWTNIDALIVNGEIVSPDLVLTEIERGTDDLAKMLKTKTGLFVPSLNAKMAVAVTAVLAACPTLANVDSPKNEADPFVVALALNINATVICQERPAKGPTGRQRIPNACDLMGIPCVSWQDFLREMGWTF